MEGTERQPEHCDIDGVITLAKSIQNKTTYRQYTRVYLVLHHHVGPAKKFQRILVSSPVAMPRGCSTQGPTALKEGRYHRQHTKLIIIKAFCPTMRRSLRFRQTSSAFHCRLL